MQSKLKLPARICIAKTDLWLPISHIIEPFIPGSHDQPLSMFIEWSFLGFQPRQTKIIVIIKLVI
jgi:hypothetical protein